MLNLDKTSYGTGITTIWLERTEARNAFDLALIRQIRDAFRTLNGDASIRGVVLATRGTHFSAGADIKWMRAAAAATADVNRAEALEMAEMFRAISDCEKATCARVQGDAHGGALGLIAACDTAIAAPGAWFSFSEVKVGLVPAILSAFAAPKIGFSAARSLFTTGRRFDADEALRIGLIHQVVLSDTLDQWVAAWAKDVIAAAPHAVATAKRLTRPFDADTLTQRLAELADLIARTRASDEGREGLSAFLEKRRPNWSPRGA
ncbi:MAG: enoyl-CoA hydratase/isomerase family protein [Deltaproteobacteria bacterium]|nr:enoyl-CoA hydratase/isomerase family protein [Deltaproteobacteria bacterium]